MKQQRKYTNIQRRHITRSHILKIVQLINELSIHFDTSLHFKVKEIRSKIPAHVK